MTYTFHRCQLHAGCPGLLDWRLAIRPGDTIDLLTRVHRGVSIMYFNKFGQDPHIQADELRRDLYNPITLATKWLQTAEKFLADGETVLVNVNGGMSPASSTAILETAESDTLDWAIRYADERITISRWPEGRRDYLCSSRGRVFVPDKYSQYADALKAARRCAGGSNHFQELLSYPLLGARP